MQPILLAATAEKVTIEEAETTSPILDDGLPAPTFAQIAYWRELCGAISATGAGGMTDDAWSADLCPPKPTLKAMAERGPIVRRRRA